jgi:uncharacterized protein
MNYTNLIELILKYPRRWLWLSLVFIFSFIPGLLMLKSDYGSRIWYNQADPLIQALNKFERNFGNDEFIGYVLYDQDGVFTEKQMLQLRELTQNAWTIQDVVRVDSLANSLVTDVSGDDFKVSKLLPDGSFDVDKIKNYALSEKNLRGTYVDEKGQMLLVYARLRPIFEQNLNYQDIVLSAQNILNQTNLSEFEMVDLFGTAKVTDAYREVNNRDIAKLLPFMLLMVLAFLWWNFKSIEAVLIPFAVLGLSVLASFGLMGYLGLKFNNLSSCIPGILLAISIADTVHVLSNFYKNFQSQQDFNLALRESLIKNFSPTLFTSLSTAIGFATLLTSSIIPIRDLGVIAGFGTLVAWLLTIFMLPGLFSYIPTSWILKTKVRKTSFLNVTHHQASKFVSFLFIYRFIIVASVVVLSVSGIYLSSKNIVNSDPLEYFDKKVPVRKTYDFIRDQLKSVGGPEIVIHSGAADGVKNPQFLRKVEEFEQWILSNVNTAKSVHSLVHVIKDLNQKFNQNQSEYYVIPSSQELVAQYLFLYTMNLPEGLDLNNRVTADFETMRLTVMWNIPDAHRSVIEIDKINAKAQEMGLNAYVSGQMPLYHRLNGYVVQTFVSSMSLAIILVALFMIWILRSVKMGLFSMIPNVIPLTFGGAIMYLNKTDIDLGAAINYSVCLGVVVDDTIHFLFDYNRRRKSGLSIHESITQVFVQTGPALVLTTVILTVGFGLFYFSEFVPNINFGLYCAIIFIFALIMDIIFLPALLLLNHRKGLE